MKKVFLFFVVFFSFVSVSAGWGEDLCEDVTCSGHGECQDDGEDEWCVCDEGYIADGLDCILGCNGVTCSGHGICSVVSGAEVCSCEAGFHASGLNCILNEASTVDTLAILNETDCYNTGNCHYRLIFATNAYSFNPSIASLYDIIVNVLDSENVWHNYRRTVAQCVTEGVCDNVDAQYVDFWFQHEVNGNQYITVEVLGNGDDASDDMYHDVLIDYCYNVDCGTGGSCDDSSGYPVCSCDYGYVLRGGICEEGWFEDENLAAAVVDLLKYRGYDVETETDIDPEMLEDITSLQLKGKNISSLAGIGLFSSLGVLNISGNNISDLSPLAACVELEVLNMSGNPASDLTPLSALSLISIDISYSGVYNMQPLAGMSTLEEVIFADSVRGKYEMLLPGSTNVLDWLFNNNGTSCFKFFPGYLPVRNPDCSGHGVCVNGGCMCEAGYVSHAGDCYAGGSCSSDEHWNPALNICVKNSQAAKCPEPPENAEIVDEGQLIWNGREYVLPEGRTAELCRQGDSSCAGSVCHWDCADGYHFAKDDICVPDAARDIPESAYNQFILPNISRSDAALEPVPGVPSFVPVLKAGIYYNEKKNLEAGWHLDLPRVEFAVTPHRILPLSHIWDEKTIYVYMPWGKEEYSIRADVKCFDAVDSPAACRTAADFHNAARLEVTYYPAPGQNLFSYIVLETTGMAFSSSLGHIGTYFQSNDRLGKDTWTVRRYGNDGSVTEFYRGLIAESPFGNTYTTRPAYYDFMDYIPIVKHMTRDGKETSFKYLWNMTATEKGDAYNYTIRSVSIIDPLKRVIEVKSFDEDNSGTLPYGLMGRPDPEQKAAYKPLEGKMRISAGRADANGNVNLNSLRTLAEYRFRSGFDMEAYIYRNGEQLRIDSYSSYPMKLESYSLDRNKIGETTWITNKNNGTPEGYTERKLVSEDSSNIYEYIVRRVKGTYHSLLQGKNTSIYAAPFPGTASSKITTVYSHEIGGVPSIERIVEDYFTDWMQPAKRVTCAYNGSETCDNAANTVTEEIKYNVSGSPIYFRNADGQVTVNLYDITEETGPEQYMRHYFLDPSGYSNFPLNNISVLDSVVRADNLFKSGTPACSAVYSLDAANGSIGEMLNSYVWHGILPDSGWCSNALNRRVTNYEWDKEAFGKPYDLQNVTYPDGKVREFTYDYEISEGSAGKVWGETITGSNNQNTLQTCYEYNTDYQLTAQGIGTATNCNKKKGFSFDSDSGLLMIQDYLFDENQTPVLENDYIYDKMGRKLVERNSAGVSTLYVYDSLDRVVFTFFGCNLNNNNSVVFGRIYEPYDFNGDDSAGDDGSGAMFRSNFPYNDFTCEYYRKYKYDEMSNLTETFFFEYWGVNENNQIKPLDRPKIIKQETKYDMLGRAVKSCQFDVAQPSNKRCIETEHDAFGNIVKKEEAVYDQNDLKRNDVQGEIREITYDLRNRPLTVTVDGLPTEQYSYSSSASGGYFGSDSIRNKYENILPLTTYKDRWGRAAKSVDPFGNETETTYESDYSDNITSQITTTSSSLKTGETTWTYDDLDRKLSETRKQFIPGLESTTNVNHQTWWEYDGIGNVVSVESSDGTKQSYSYDSLNRPVETVNYEKINSNDVETSYSENSYDTNGRLSRTETTRNNQTITEDYGFDTFGRITSVKTTDPANSSRYRLKFYNTGGQVIWEADEESDGSLNDFNNLNILDVEVGNEKYYSYNAFGDLEKTVYVMTNSGKGRDSLDLNPWLNNGKITTNFEYDIFGRIKKRINDRSGITQYNYYQNNTTGSHRRNKLQSIQIFPALTNGDTDFYDNESIDQTYTYTYDDKGDEASVEYTEGNNYSLEVSFTRDGYGRITGKTSNGSVPVTQTFTYNNRNLLETATDTVGNATTSVTRLYDSFGNPYSEAVSTNNITKTVSRRMTDAKTYQFTYPDGKILRKTATGSDLDLIEYGTPGNLAEIAAYSRTNGVLTAVTKGQNLTETFSYNTWNQLANHTISNAPNNDIYKMNYGYSRGWHLVEKADGIKHTSDKYTYDSYYRLKEVKYDFANNTAARTDNFYQDGVHNIEQSTENGTTFAWGVDKLNRLRNKKVGSNTDAAYEYDERNNMIGEDFDGSEPADISYIYDDLNRLIEVKDGSNQTIATYTYDAFNRRITKTVGNTTERYSYDDWDIVEIATNSGNYTNIIDSGADRHIAIEVTSNNTSTLFYFLTDERGNVTALTDANGNVLERYRYRVYGDFEILDTQFTPKNCNNQTCYATNLHNFLWGGSLYEPETNLYWMRNRYYHIDMHRFINQDPIGIWGDANNLGNGFAYVAGMVIEASDPTGLDNIKATIKGPINTEPPQTTAEWYVCIFSPANPDVATGGYQELQAEKLGELVVTVSEWLYNTVKDYMESRKIVSSSWKDGETQGSFTMNLENGQFEQTLKDKSGTTKSFGNFYSGNFTEIDYSKDGTPIEKREYEEGELKRKWKWQVVGKDENGNNIYDWVEIPIGSMPNDPYSDNDAQQNFVRNQFLKKILKKHEKKNFLEMMSEEGPVVKYEDNGRKVFVFNPYYRGKDPLKEIFWETKNADGTKGFVRNPFAPGAEYGYDATTYEKFQQAGFPQTNVDPYWY